VKGGIVLPSHVLTVTLNPALDKTIIVEGFETAKTNRSCSAGIDLGGKGINVAKILKILDYPVIATGFIAVEETQIFTAKLNELGIENDFVVLPGEIRLNLKIIDPVNFNETEINAPGFIINNDNAKELLNKLNKLLPDCALMVLSGSLPQGASNDIYHRLIDLGKSYGVESILDAEGEALELALSARPLLVKPNKYEAELLLNEKLETPEDAAIAGKKIIKMGPHMVVISMGPLGAVGVTENEALWAKPPAVHVVSTVGAGDAMVAVLAKSICEGVSLRISLPQAVAAGTILSSKGNIKVDMEECSKLIQIMPI
jgi:1-phosphofructokinase